jgi:hypothetical protein
MASARADERYAFALVCQAQGHGCPVEEIGIDWKGQRSLAVEAIGASVDTDSGDR